MELKLSRQDGVTLRVVDGRDGLSIYASVTVFDSPEHGGADSQNGMRFSWKTRSMSQNKPSSRIGIEPTRISHH